MRNIMILAILVSGAVVKADIIKCSFTEPFVSVVYSTTTNEMTVSVAGEKTTVQKNVSFQIKGPAVFELLSADKKNIMTLTLNNKGSDGMSDVVYPYDALYNMDGYGSYYGGCSSNFLPADRSADDSDHN